MERELWTQLYRLVQEVEATIRQKAVRYQPGIIAAVFLWAALHDRPTGWACDPRHWGTAPRPGWLPSPSTLSRRLRSIAVGMIFKALERRVRETVDRRLIQFIDAKPLPVGGATHDHEARYGRAAGVNAKGYKLFALWGMRPMPESWSVAPINVAETAQAPNLISRAPGAGYLLGDSIYDSSTLYDIAWTHGYQMVAPRKKPTAGLSHSHYQSPHRLRAIELLRTGFGCELLGLRGGIERAFGNATSFGCGLGPLPAWVRGLTRVVRWVWAKLLINAARILIGQRLTISMQ
jgi:Transposase DDE domain